MSQNPEIINTTNRELLYAKPLSELTSEEVMMLADMAFERGESWKLREIIEYADAISEEYAKISAATQTLEYELAYQQRER